jgi:hypothetical protein
VICLPNTVNVPSFLKSLPCLFHGDTSDTDPIDSPELIVYIAIREHKNLVIVTELVILQPQRLLKRKDIVG